jgi:glutamate synthase (NADPH/NADH) small chain
MSIKDVLQPFSVWKNIFKEPWTIKDPIRERIGADRYRGFHKNDMEACIGCGTCEEICQNAAIDMIPVEGIETTLADSGLRPQIDYGRCCWCALCVDVCTTKSLDMSNEYIWIDADPEVFRFVPGVDDKSWNNSEKGYKKPDNYEITGQKSMVHMSEMSGDERKNNFLEFMAGYSEEEAILEADRCVECGLCIASCPAHMDIPQYIRAIREGDMSKGLQIIYETNPLPETCGRICPQTCAAVCAVGHKGESVAIRWLKRYISDQVLFENYDESLLREPLEKDHKKVAIIGAGPAGVTSAYYLRMAGVASDIYDMMPAAGGMMRYGIPEYRMPKQLLDEEIMFLKELGGVDFHFNKKLGENLDIDTLKKEYDAVIIAVGSWASSSMRTEGEEHAVGGIEFLKEIAVNDWSGKNPGKTLVIGGGNTAMDCVRTSVRLGSDDVSIIYRRTEKEMPAENDEIREAKEEGVKFELLTAPVKVREENGKKVLTCVKMELGEPDASGRRRPVPVEGSEFDIEADIIISAIGQKTVAPEGIPTNKWGDVEADEVTNYVSDNVFTAGDCVIGPQTVIKAVHSGRITAEGVKKFFKIKDPS